jgi:hypothetical protein
VLCACGGCGDNTQICPGSQFQVHSAWLAVVTVLYVRWSQFTHLYNCSFVPFEQSPCLPAPEPPSCSMGLTFLDDMWDKTLFAFLSLTCVPKFIHTVPNGRLSFFSWLNNIHCIPIFFPFIHRWTLRFFCVWGGCYDHRTVNTGVQLALWDADLISFSYVLRSGIAGSYGNFILIFLGELHSIFYICTNLHSHQQYTNRTQDSSFSSSFPTLLSGSFLLFISIYNCTNWVSLWHVQTCINVFTSNSLYCSPLPHGSLLLK